MSSALAVRVRRSAPWVVLVMAGAAALVGIAVGTSVPPRLLDPGSAGPGGGKALVQVLRNHGVTVQVVRSRGELGEAHPSGGSTVVMTDPEFLGADSAAALGRVSATADRLVLLSPTSEQLQALGLPLASTEVSLTEELSAACQGGDSTRTPSTTGQVVTSGDRVSRVDVRFFPRTDDTHNPESAPNPQWCFRLPDPAAATPGTLPRTGVPYGAAMATLPATAGRPEVVILGFNSALTNRWVDEDAHAGLAVRALGRSPRLVWYQPDIGDLADLRGGHAASPWPRWLGPGAAVIATAVLLLAVVRGRRMGPLAVEPLPVIVRAAETTESRGRIYRKARDRARAAAILRQAATKRIARRLAIPDRDVAAVAAAASDATASDTTASDTTASDTTASDTTASDTTASDTTASDTTTLPPVPVRDLLLGPPPATDAELLDLARSLTDLEERLHPR